ncbi:MAG: VOC family protein [Thermoplasmata archaeon]|nr:VOC family protein [Thermoplasmata archaeon]
MPAARAKLHGPMFPVKDIEESLRFYRDRIGVRGSAAGPWAEFHTGSARWVLLDRGFWAKAVGREPAARRTSDPERVVLAIQVRDVAATHRRLTRLGLRFESPPMDVPQMGNRVALLRDPDGNRVELTSLLTAEDLARVRPAKSSKRRTPARRV